MNNNEFKDTDNMGCSIIFIMCFILFLVWLMSGCGSVGTITKFADGTISETHAITFGSTAAVTDFKDNISANGRRISFGSGNSDVNVEALQQSNEILGKLLEGAVKGMK
jgi:hypothetical protein